MRLDSFSKYKSPATMVKPYRLISWLWSLLLNLVLTRLTFLMLFFDIILNKKIRKKEKKKENYGKSLLSRTVSSWLTIKILLIANMVVLEV